MDQDLQKLVAEKESIAKQLEDLDAKGETGAHVDELRKKYEELAAKIESAPISEDI